MLTRGITSNDTNNKDVSATIKSRFNFLESPHYLRAQLHHDLIVHLRRMRKALHDILKQLNQDLIVVDVGAPQGAQLNHD